MLHLSSWGLARAIAFVWRSEDKLQDLVSSSARRILGIKFRSSGLLAVTLDTLIFYAAQWSLSIDGVKVVSACLTSSVPGTPMRQ